MEPFSGRFSGAWKNVPLLNVPFFCRSVVLAPFIFFSSIEMFLTNTNGQSKWNSVYTLFPCFFHLPSGNDGPSVAGGFASVGEEEEGNREREGAVWGNAGSATLTESGGGASAAPAWPLRHKEGRPINSSASWEEVCVPVYVCVCACVWVGGWMGGWGDVCLNACARVCVRVYVRA